MGVTSVGFSVVTCVDALVVGCMGTLVTSSGGSLVSMARHMRTYESSKLPVCSLHRNCTYHWCCREGVVKCEKSLCNCVAVKI